MEPTLRFFRIIGSFSLYFPYVIYEGSLEDKRDLQLCKAKPLWRQSVNKTFLLTKLNRCVRDLGVLLLRCARNSNVLLLRCVQNSGMFILGTRTVATTTELALHPKTLRFYISKHKKRSPKFASIGLRFMYKALTRNGKPQSGPC